MSSDWHLSGDHFSENDEHIKKDCKATATENLIPAERIKMGNT